MTIRVVVAGATGWTGSALVAAILKSGDLALAGAVARSVAGRDAGEAIGLKPAGVRIAASLGEALAVPSDVVVDYTKPDVVKGNVLTALKAGRHVVVGTSSSARRASRRRTMARSTGQPRRPEKASSPPGIFRSRRRS
jgi:4-hydroxy-tetrahydrodipicolinate reductase